MKPLCAACTHCDAELELHAPPIPELRPTKSYTGRNDPEGNWDILALEGVRLEFNDNLTLEGVYAGGYTLLSDGTTWAIFYQEDDISGDRWYDDLAEALKEFARAIKEKRTEEPK
jgi:hypothetical protein